MLSAREIAHRSGKSYRDGAGYRIRCPAAGHEDRNPSCSVKDGDNGRPIFHCHANCDLKDVLSGAEALGWIEPFKPSRKSKGRHTRILTLEEIEARESRRREERREFERRLAYALQLCADATDPTGTVVETYLRSRGFDAPIPSTIRYGRVRHSGTGAFYHAMVAALCRWPDTDPCAAHVTYLNDQGKKAVGEDSRRMFGHPKGGAIQLDEPGTELGIGRRDRKRFGSPATHRHAHLGGRQHGGHAVYHRARGREPSRYCG